MFLREIGRYSDAEAERLGEILQRHSLASSDFELRLVQPLVHYQFHQKKHRWLFLSTNYENYLASLHVAKQQAGFHFHFEHGERYKWRGLIAVGQQEAEALLDALRPISRIAFWPDYTGVSQTKKVKVLNPKDEFVMSLASVYLDRTKVLRERKELGKKIDHLRGEESKARARGQHNKAEEKLRQLEGLMHERTDLQVKIARLKEKEQHIRTKYITGLNSIC